MQGFAQMKLNSQAHQQLHNIFILAEGKCFQYRKRKKVLHFEKCNTFVENLIKT